MTIRWGATALLAATTAALVGCSGSPAPPAASSRAGQGTSPRPGGTGPGSGANPSTPAPSRHPTPAAPPRDLQALALLTAAGLPAALRAGGHGYQDDGGTATTYPSLGFASEADTETTLTRFRVSLQSWDTPATASDDYDALTRSGGTPMTGLGEKAMDQIGEQIVVLEGSQVLVVGVDLTPAGEDYLAAHGKSPAALLAVMDRPARSAAKALAAHLSGHPATGTYLQLPAGALDPCNLSTAAIGAATKQPVTAVHAPSENRPAQQCDVAIGGSPFLVQTYTSAQAAAAVPTTTVAAVYATDLRAPTVRNRRQMAGPHVKAFMAADADFVLEILATPDGAGFRADAPETAHQALVRIKNAHTGPLTRAQCYALGEDAAQQLVLGHPDAEWKAFFDELVNWCSSFPASQ